MRLKLVTLHYDEKASTIITSKSALRRVTMAQTQESGNRPDSHNGNICTMMQHGCRMLSFAEEMIF